MKLFKTSAANYINLDQVSRFVCAADSITLHFDGANLIMLRGDDAKKLTQLIAEYALEGEGRELTH